ncbi:MAG: hypothetical protein LBK06_06075 [Planctomycetaceae bacterium]|nr:hypothetical protein [Planctomycetaceae bacterium]
MPELFKIHGAERSNRSIAERLFRSEVYRLYRLRYGRCLLCVSTNWLGKFVSGGIIVTIIRVFNQDVFCPISVTNINDKIKINGDN